MQLSSLSKLVEKSKKRVGRGHGSGRGGHTSGRGAKGDKARGDTKQFFEGTKAKKSLIKRLPFMRGKDKFVARSKRQIVKLSQLSVFKDGEKVSLSSLFEKGLIKDKKFSAVILNQGEIKTKLILAVACSKSVREKIEKLGGEVIGQLENEEPKEKPQKAVVLKKTKKVSNKN